MSFIVISHWVKFVQGGHSRGVESEKGCWVDRFLSLEMRKAQDRSGKVTEGQVQRREKKGGKRRSKRERKKDGGSELWAGEESKPARQSSNGMGVRRGWVEKKLVTSSHQEISNRSYENQQRKHHRNERVGAWERRGREKRVLRLVVWYTSDV